MGVGFIPKFTSISSRCVSLLHISCLYHTTCIELNLLEDYWGSKYYLVDDYITTRAHTCLCQDRSVHLEMEYGGMSSLV